MGCWHLRLGATLHLHQSKVCTARRGPRKGLVTRLRVAALQRMLSMRIVQCVLAGTLRA